ncbi:histidine kinase [Pseudoflavitalea sp. G-6-1-2]|uniref:sensor histidine kinase n=1 Tax=Pseudoflavitalea sp. G-6-1-2 TaxID=2728841 RepID=UPI00146A6DC9|nr:histidine kinase [Pseudoflavitalea sp. G-6-1-2]NML20251.1 histidine kinase [Pseudoflavitalea sp. G-6-1-2]
MKKKDTQNGSGEFAGSEKFFTSTAFRYGSRALILYLFSNIFKSFDLTFIGEMSMFSFRSNMFSLAYVLYGLIVWDGASFLAKTLERKMHGFSAGKRILLLSTTLLAYGALISLGFGFVYAGVDLLLFNRAEAWHSFKELSYNMNVGIFMFYLIIITFNGFIFYYKSWKEYQIKAERLMRENIQAKYDALKNQIDPHFFFNSLSVLTNLVYKDPDLAADYITQLANTFRYILDKKLDNLVPIATELNFLQSYLFLIGIRRQGSIIFMDQIDEQVKLNGQVPPATLQMLVENAIKHNRFSASEPLEVTIRSEQGFLFVSNTIRKKITPEYSHGIGLENIQKRYELVCGRSIEIDASSEKFVVKIPIIFSHESDHF